LFFSWYFKNKHFKQRNNFSGQIIPFLLVVLVILLIAAIAVIQIGKVSIDKTCASNAADAGSLAAASSWAASMNSLAYDNYDLKANFDNYRELVSNKFLPEANYYLTQAALNSRAALINSACASFFTLLSIPCPPCFSIAPILAAAIFFDLGEKFAVTAEGSLTNYLILVDYMSSAAELCFNDQLQKYTDMTDKANEFYLAARKEGFKYAFSNSCIESKLSDEQSNDFNSWLVSILPQKVEAGETTIKYSWLDKNSQNHEVSVTLELPNIKSYMLWHTQNGLSKTQDFYAKSRMDGEGILSSIDSQVSQLVVASIMSKIATGLAILACAFSWCPAGWAIKIVEGIVNAANALTVGMIISGIIAFISAFGVGKSSLESMLNNIIADDSWEDSSKSGVRFLDPSESPADVVDFIIVAIEDVKFETDKWEAKCSVTQTHPRAGMSGGEYIKTSSHSTSRVDNGSMKVVPFLNPIAKDQEVQAKERADEVVKYESLGGLLNFEQWVGSKNPDAPQEKPDVTESIIESTINANYSPEIVDVN
jgi:hypothetical protein